MIHPNEPLDIVVAGRACVDMYAEQVGASLAVADSFVKYVGGSALNISVGLARLGLRTALLSGVGDEDMGRYVRESLEAEGIVTDGLVTVPGKLTSLVLLAIRSVDGFPRIFYAREGADLGVLASDIDGRLMERARAVLVGGTYLSSDTLREYTSRLVGLAKTSAAKIILDIDYRPVLWGLVGPGSGSMERYRCVEATMALAEIFPTCDLIIGTEAEFELAGDSDNLVGALRRVRELTAAPLVLKRGAQGSVVFAGDIPDDIASGAGSARAYPVEVVNSAGAGDGYMAGFLSAWLRGSSLEDCAQTGNAAGAIVVARHGCAPAMPTAEELTYFMQASEPITRPSANRQLGQLHRIAGRTPTPERLYVLAFDHRWQIEELADRYAASRERIRRLKWLIWEGWQTVASKHAEVGILADDLYSDQVLEAASGSGHFVARALDEPASLPLRLLGEPEVASFLRTWPKDQVVKVIAYMGSGDPDELTADQTRTLVRAQRACWKVGRELLVEIQAPPGKAHEPGEVARIVDTLIAGGIEPEWWKLPPLPNANEWDEISSVVQSADVACRGLLVLGQGSTVENLEVAFAAAAPQPLCRGFAVGRTIFAEVAEAWLSGSATDDEASRSIAERFLAIIDVFEKASLGRGSSNSKEVFDD